MKILLTNALRKGALSLVALSGAILIGGYLLLTPWTADTALPVLACTASWEIDHGDDCGDIVVPAAGIKIANNQSLGNVLIEQFTESIIVNEQRSVGKVLGIHPDRNEQLAATISFQYQEEDLGDLPEDQLILYSSQDDGHSWQAHYNSIVDPINNSIHLSGVEHFSLWTAAPSDRFESAGTNTATSTAAALPFTTNTSIDAGAYIINMGVEPQTVGNALKPYGLIYTLLREYQVPIEWVINPNKTKDGIDFTYAGTGYKGGPFIIRPEFRNPTIDAVIAAWEAQGVVGVTTTTNIVVPVYRTITYFMFWTLDAGNGGIAEGYLQNAGIPESGYNWVAVGDLTCCDDIFVMPHADPEWNDGALLQHGRLFTWNQDIGTPDGCDGSIWAACHAVSALELMFNPNDPTQQTNFLSTKTGTAMGGGPYATPNNSLVEWGDHGEADGPYDYFSPTHPVMQFLGSMDDAMQNGSEQSYMPVIGAQWRPTTVKGITIPSHPDKPSLTLDPIKMVFGDAYGDPTRGKVMYEAGHSHNGSAPANIAAQRAFFNFSFWAVEGKAITVDIGSVPETLEGGADVITLTASAAGGTGVYEYQWVSECPGTFSNPVGQTTTFTPAFVSEGVNCAIKCIVMDDCGTRSSFDSRAVTIVPAPVPPVANNDSEFTNPAVPVTLSPLDNDTDLNLDIDPATLTFWNSTTMMAIGSSFMTANGTFTINFDGTVTYVSNPGFMGVETIDYQICDETEPADGGPFCDVATITITVDETDEFGCTPLEEYRTLYTAYGTGQSNNTFGKDWDFTLGHPDGNVAELNANATPASRGRVTISLDNFVLTGETIKLFARANDGDGNPFTVETSFDGTTFGNPVVFTAPDNSQIYSFNYTVVNPNGVAFVRITNNSAGDKLFFDAVSYEVKDCQTICVLPEVQVTLNGTANAADASSTAGNEDRAVGLPNFEASDVGAGEFLILDMGETIPPGAQIQLFLANDSQSPEPTLDVTGSLDNMTYNGLVNFLPESDKDVRFGQFFYTVTQPSGLRYLRFSGNINTTFVDAVKYEINTCVNAVPTAVDDLTYTLEGVPVTYAVQVNDTDPLGSPITTTAITSAPANGTAVVNPDGTVTYVPNADFSGTDVLTYQICNAQGLCDEATLTIIIPDDGCVDPANLKKTGVASAVTGTDPGNNVNNEADATYYPSGVNFAEMDNPNEELVLGLANIVRPGDIVRFYVSGEDANDVNFTVEVSTDGVPANAINPVSYTVSGTAFVEFEYQVNTTGIDFIHITNNDIDEKLRVDGILYNIWECAPACVSPNTAITGDGFATAAPSGARSPGNAVGTPDKVSQEIREADSPVTVVDLGEIVPQGASVNLYMARNGTNAVTLTVQSSLTNGSFANPVTFTPTNASPNFQKYSFTVTPTMGDIRYVQLDVTAGDRVFVDAVGFFYTNCEDGTPVAMDDATATTEETPVTYPVQVNDSDPAGLLLSTTQITLGPTNGSAVINPDGTITYTPSAEFTGTDMLTYQVCNPNGLCDEAILTITVVDDGCLAGESSVIVGTGYGFTVLDPLNQVGNEGRAIGVPDGVIAELNSGGSARLEIFLSQTVKAGDVITYYVSGENVDQVDFTAEIYNGTAWVDADPQSVSGTTFMAFTYTIADAAGAQRFRLVNTDADEKLRVDGIEYNLRSCSPSGCLQSETALVQSGFAISNPASPASTANLPSNALGAPNSTFSEVDNGEFLIVNFGQVLPQGALLFFYFSSDGGTMITAKTSLSTTFGATGTAFTVTAVQPDFQQFQLEITNPAGAQFVRFDGTNGKVRVDAAQYSLFKTNSLAGFVWDDSNDEDGVFDAGEAAFAGVNVRIYEDVNASGTVNAGDLLLTTVTTNANGFYNYTFFATGLPKNYVMEVDESTLPAAPTNNYYTTAQYQTATLSNSSDSDCDNNFGRSFDNPPVAVDDAASTEQGVPITINVIGNDQNPDADGETTTVTSITSPPSSGGTVSINPDGTVNYTPPVGFTGTETFEYELCDSADPGVLCDVATVTVTVTPFVNDPPVAVDDAATTEQDMPISVNVLGNDSDPEGDFLTVSCVGTDAAAGTPGVCNGMTQQGGTVIILPSGEIYYEPPVGFTGMDQTTYVICDPSGLCDEAVIIFTIDPDTNTPPIATDDPNVVIYQPCGATTFSVVENDFDLDGNIVPSSITITMPLSPSTGALVNNMDGTFTYTPAGAGTFTFEYQVCDDGTPLPAQCDVATVTMTVEANNSAPIASDDTDVISANQDLTTGVLNNDSDPDGDDLIVTLCDPNNPTTACGLASSTSTQGGTVIVLPSGKTRYTPPAGFAGTDTYFYRICDATCPAQQLCDFAMVTVMVENQPPVAVNDAAATAINTLVNIPVLPNDFDPEGQTITVQSGGDNPTTPTGNGTTQGGTIALLGDGTFDYTPPLNFIGQDTFYYQICDDVAMPLQGCDIARVIVTVTSPIDVELVKSVFPTEPDAGDNVTFTLTISNNSAALATGVVVRDKLPSGLTYVSDNGGGTYDEASGIWFVGNIAAGGSKSIQIVATVVNFNDATNVGEVIDQDQIDTDSTPNNGMLAEDDQSAVILQCVLKIAPIGVSPN